LQLTVIEPNDPPPKFSRQTYEMQLRLHNRKSQCSKITFLQIFLGHKVIRVLSSAPVAYCMRIITLKTSLNEKVGYRFCQITVAQPEWDQRRRGHGLPKNKLGQIFAGALYLVSALRKSTEGAVGLKTMSVTEDVID